MEGPGASNCDEAGEIQIRSANESDLNCLTEMALELQEHVEASNPNIWRLSPLGRKQLKTEMIEALEDLEGKVIMAVASRGFAVAFAIGRVEAHEKYLGGNVGYFEKIYMREKWRRRGVGSRLVRSLMDFFLDKGADDLTLRYVAGNREAEWFWTGLGFEPRIEIVGIDSEGLARNLGQG